MRIDVIILATLCCNRLISVLSLFLSIRLLVPERVKMQWAPPLTPQPLRRIHHSEVPPSRCNLHHHSRLTSSQKSLPPPTLLLSSHGSPQFLDSPQPESCYLEGVASDSSSCQMFLLPFLWLSLHLAKEKLRLCWHILQWTTAPSCSPVMRSQEVCIVREEELHITQEVLPMVLSGRSEVSVSYTQCELHHKHVKTGKPFLLDYFTLLCIMFLHNFYQYVQICMN